MISKFFEDCIMIYNWKDKTSRLDGTYVPCYVAGIHLRLL